jgi:hypothetical protein
MEKAASGIALPREGNGATAGDGTAAGNGNGAVAGDGGVAATAPIGTKAGTRRKRKKVQLDKIQVRQTSYMFFANLKRDSILEKHPGLSVPDLGKKAGELWRDLPHAEQMSYKCQAAGRPVTKQRKQRQSPSTPMTPYLLFYEMKRPQLQAENAGMSILDMARQCGLLWRAMSVEEKQPFLEAHAQQKEAALLAAAASDTVLRAGEVEEAMTVAEPNSAPLPPSVLYRYVVPPQVVRYENEQALPPWKRSGVSWPWMPYRSPSPPAAPPPPHDSHESVTARMEQLADMGRSDTALRD